LKAAFRGHNIPPGLICMKAAEFMKLTQGTKTLAEYMHAFNNLSRYAPEFVDTEAKKIESFKRGHSTKLMKTMANSKCATYNDFVNDALTKENQNNLHAVAKGRKRAVEAGASSSSHSRLQWQLGHNSIRQHLNSGLPSRKHRPVVLSRCFLEPSLLPYPRVKQAREAPQGQKAIYHALITTKPTIGLGNAHIRRVQIRIKATKSKLIQRHVLDMCTI